MKDPKQQTPTFFTLLKAIVLVDVLIFICAGVFTWYRFGFSLPDLGYVLLWVGAVVGLLGISPLFGRCRIDNFQARNLAESSLTPQYGDSPRRITGSGLMSDDYRIIIVLVSAGILSAFVGSMLYPYF